MLLKDFGGEFAFINQIIPHIINEDVLVGIGDDAAVFKLGNERIVVTTDTIVEGDHFSLNYFTYYQIGIKAIESSASDLVAMGASPKYVFISLCLPASIEVEPLRELYRGMQSACSRIGAIILGGDTTHNQNIIISATFIGSFKEGDRVVTRRGAKPGDLVVLSGSVGASVAGLLLYKNDVPDFVDLKLKHCEPKCRVDLVEFINLYATSAIDISDGLSSEIHHICKLSNVGAIIDEEKLPLTPSVIEAGKVLNIEPALFAYSGGEDFEILFTVSPSESARIFEKSLHVIGSITEQKEVLKKLPNGEHFELKNIGYDHFR